MSVIQDLLGTTTTVTRLALPELSSVGHIGRVKKNNTTPGGLWNATHINTIPFENLSPPYGVVKLGRFQNVTADAASDTDTYLVDVEVLYLDDYLGGFAGYLEKLWTLRRALNQHDRTEWDFQQVVSMDDSDDLLINNLLAAKGVSVRAGQLVFQVVVSEPYRFGM